MTLPETRLHVLVAAFSRETRRRLVGLVRAVGVESIIEAASSDDALTLAHRSEINLALIDPRVATNPNDDSGLELVSKLRKRRELTAVIVGDEPDLSRLRRAMRYGASDWWIARDLDSHTLRMLIDELHTVTSPKIQPLPRTPRQPRKQVMIGRSAGMAQLNDQIERAASSHYPVLVRGPSGAGKELVVRELHRLGQSPDAPLLDLNCGAIPDNLLESQLFGHKRGSFTGADRDHEGYLSATGSGTLFLDEIAELPLALQAKLLRVLESNRYRMVGSTAERTFAGRVIAATHSDLEARCQAKEFREDLFYRLAVLEVRVPALAERRDDVPLLLDHFIAQHDRRFEFDAAAIKHLKAYSWPGNIRQLRNLVARVALLCDADYVDPPLVERFLHRPRRAYGEEEALCRFADSVLGLELEDKFSAAQDVLISRSLARHGGNKSAAARALGIHRKVLERRLVKRTPNTCSSGPARFDHALD